MIAVMLFLMLLFMISLPKLVFASENNVTLDTSNDPIPRYTLAPKAIGDKVAEAIAQTGIVALADATIELDDPNTIYGADEPVHVEVSGLQADAKSRKWSANILFKNDTRVISAMPMQGKFQPMVELPTFIKPYESAAIISEDNIAMKKFPAHYARSGVVSTADAMVGKAARRNISADRPIRENEISSPMVMQKNDIIQLSFSSNNLHITTSGQVLANAAMGDVVEVKNLSSNQVVRAVVKDDKTASVLPFVATSDLGGERAKFN
jgi:flagella basal body P-ring formation protein FlgA